MAIRMTKQMHNIRQQRFNKCARFRHIVDTSKFQAILRDHAAIALYKKGIASLTLRVGTYIISQLLDRNERSLSIDGDESDSWLTYEST